MHFRRNSGKCPFKENSVHHIWINLVVKQNAHHKVQKFYCTYIKPFYYGWLQINLDFPPCPKSDDLSVLLNTIQVH